MSEICTLQCGMLVAAPSVFCCFSFETRAPGAIVCCCFFFTGWGCVTSHRRLKQQLPQQFSTAKLASPATTTTGQTKVRVWKASAIRVCVGRCWKARNTRCFQADLKDAGPKTLQCLPRALSRLNYRGGKAKNWHPFSRSWGKKTDYSVNKSQYARLHAPQSNLL